MEATHASFFSGVGGLDLGLERAGWRTVSFSEIDPYANAVLAERWLGVPNLGDIVTLADGWRSGQSAIRADLGCLGTCTASRHGASCPYGASLWSGGFPCQDLSVAGKRRGLAGARSGLAFAFLDLVERHRPPAVLLENVPGLLSSHGGKDLGALLGRLGELGYWWAYRILDARHFGVPQRRRRVFIVGLHSERGFGPDSAAAVLSVGARCPRHPATGHQTGEGVAAAAGERVVGTLNFGAHIGIQPAGQSAYSGQLIPVGETPDPGGVREADGLAGGLDDLAPTLRVGPARPQDGGPADTVPVIAFRKSARVNADPTSPESWVNDGLANTLNDFDVGDIRTTHAVVGGRGMTDEPLLPLGLDSHRYRCCGNGVVSSVSEWIGTQLLRVIENAA